MFAFQGSPSSLRILDVPKSIGTWEIKTVKVAISYPDNTTNEKTAVRTGSVWVATIEGCEIAGKVAGGYQVTADGIDEDGNEVTGYVLGKGDVFVMEDNIDVKALVEKVAVRYLEDMPSNPVAGDFIEHHGQMNFYDGEQWIRLASGEEVPTKVSQLENDVGYITESAIPSNISSFTNDVGYITASAVPTKVSELDNDVGYITASAIPTNVGAFTNDVGYLTSVSWGEVQDKPDVALMSDLPSKVSELTNDVGYITAAQVPPNPSKLSELTNDAGYVTSSAVAADYYNKVEVSAFLSTKQDALDEDEITMIGQVTDERKTVLTFTDNTSEEYEWSGEITRNNIVDAGLWDVDHGGWIKEPLSIKVGTAVTRLGNYAFANAHYLTSIDIPSTVTNIGQYCLYDCSALTSITIPYSMKVIGGDTFGLCSSLTSVTIPNSVESIGAAAFENCTSLSTLLIPDSVTSIGIRAF